MTRFSLANSIVVIAAVVAVTACENSPYAKLKKAAQPTFYPRDSLPCEEAIQLQTAKVIPEVRWMVGDGVSPEKFMSCLTSGNGDSATIEAMIYLASDLYKLARECKESGQPNRYLLEYKHKSRPYLMRLHATEEADPYTYVVILSRPKGSKYFAHYVEEKTNSAESLKLCRLIP